MPMAMGIFTPDGPIHGAPQFSAWKSVVLVMRSGKERESTVMISWANN